MEYRIKKKLSRWEIFWGGDRPRYYVQFKLLDFGPLGSWWVDDINYSDINLAKIYINRCKAEDSAPDVEPVEEYIYYP
jgi:hypothetical protein